MIPGGPPRLRTDDSAPWLLRAALDADVDEPSSDDLQNLAASLGIGFAAPLSSAAAASSPSSGVLAIVKSKIVSAIIAPALAGTVAATALLKATESAREPSPPPRPETAVTAPTTDRIRPPSPPSPGELAQTPAPVEPNAAPPTRQAPVVRNSPSEPVPIVVPQVPNDPAPDRPAPQPESEVSLLERAKALVASSPEAALALADTHASRFPNGMLQQEAQVIAIESLAQAGRARAAAERLARFRRQFPSSAYLPHLESVVHHSNGDHKNRELPP